MKIKELFSFPISKYEYKVYAAVSLHVAFGIMLSIMQDDWQHFERSGALLVIIAASLAWQDHVRLIANKVEETKRKADRIRRGLDEKPSLGLSDIDDIEEAKELDKITAIGMILVERYERRLRATELSVALAGTLIWAYGSLVMQWALPFGSA